MIIARKYEWLGILYDNDPESRKLIDEAFTLTPRAIEEKKFLLENNHCNISAFLNLGCGIPGETYQYFMKGFEALDQEHPYDNGLTFKDVTSIEYETSRKGTALQMRFVCQPYDFRYRIVGVVAIENRDGKVCTNKGWKMTPPFEIG